MKVPSADLLLSWASFSTHPKNIKKEREKRKEEDEEEKKKTFKEHFMRELLHKWDSLLSNLHCETDLKSFPELLASLHNAIKRSRRREYLLFINICVTNISLSSSLPPSLSLPHWRGEK